jgi:nicotinamidase-related amidase
VRRYVTIAYRASDAEGRELSRQMSCRALASGKSGSRTQRLRQGFSRWFNEDPNRLEMHGGQRVILPPNTALVIVDVQRAIDDPIWAADGPRNNPEAEVKIAELLALWRRLGYPLFHVKHDGTFPSSTYRPGQPGNDFKPEAAPLPGETIIVKHTNSAFIGTELDRFLRLAKINTVVICGVITNNSVEATVRMAGNLGYDTYLVEDAGFTFARKDFRGRLRSAEEVHDLSLANMSGAYCMVTNTKEVMEAIASAG